jgi:hypothetical protein
MPVNAKITKEEFSAYRSRVGVERSANRFSLLAKMDKFVTAYESDLGSELLKDLKDMEVELNVAQIMKTYKTPQEKEEDRLMLRAVVMLGIKWADKINAYNNALTEMRSTGS